jgi:hypothetical protein
MLTHRAACHLQVGFFTPQRMSPVSEALRLPLPQIQATGFSGLIKLGFAPRYGSKSCTVQLEPQVDA